MKTIEEAAREFAKNQAVLEHTFIDEGAKRTAEHACYKTALQMAEFAERWIPVEENQYPDLDLSDKFNKRQGYSETVLVKEQGRIYFGFYAKYIDSWIVSGRSGNIHVTHWRPITHR